MSLHWFKEQCVQLWVWGCVRLSESSPQTVLSCCSLVRLGRHMQGASNWRNAAGISFPTEPSYHCSQREMVLKGCVWDCELVYLCSCSSQYTCVCTGFGAESPLLMQGDKMLSAISLGAGWKDENSWVTACSCRHSVHLSALNAADSLNGIEVCLCRSIRLATNPH